MRRAFAALLLVTVPFVAACGGDGDDESSSDTTRRGATTIDTDFSGRGSDDYCEAARAYAEDENLRGLTSSDRDQVRQSVSRFQTVARDLQDKAPKEIEEDVDVLVSGLGTLARELEAVDYDFTKLDAKKLSVLSSQEFTASSQRLTAYTREVCGIEDDTTTTTAAD